MSTWNHVTIESPGALTLDSLPENLGHYLEVCTDEREDVPPTVIDGHTVYPGRPGNPDGSITLEGHTKYHVDDIEADLLELSKGRRIEWCEEWDDDGPGSSITVYLDGVVAPEEGKHMDMVPDTLADLIADVRAGLRAYETDPTFPHFHLATVALVNALDPRGAK